MRLLIGLRTFHLSSCEVVIIVRIEADGGGGRLTDILPLHTHTPNREWHYQSF